MSVGVAWYKNTHEGNFQWTAQTAYVMYNVYIHEPVYPVEPVYTNALVY